MRCLLLRPCLPQKKASRCHLTCFSWDTQVSVVVVVSYFSSCGDCFQDSAPVQATQFRRTTTCPRKHTDPCITMQNSARFKHRGPFFASYPSGEPEHQANCRELEKNKFCCICSFPWFRAHSKYKIVLSFVCTVFSPIVLCHPRSLFSDWSNKTVVQEKQFLHSYPTQCSTPRADHELRVTHHMVVGDCMWASRQGNKGHA